ncbi:MAG: 30S ribosomal protein S2, partial [Candidatus Shikimatogenerans sp. JK-2022]|nr:30S ribosomal protein S2 [Candidatus Shikimatogenerans bostrichidophilus]
KKKISIFKTLILFNMLKKKLKYLLKKINKYKVVIGHKKNIRHPKMKKYILFQKNNYDVINPLKLLNNIIKAQKILQECSCLGGSILFVSTKKQNKDIISKYSKKVNMPYINYKWPAGLLTNIKNTRISIKKKQSLSLKQKTVLKYLSKKERILTNRKYIKIKKKYGTIKKMIYLPIVIIIIDVKKEYIALKEAKDRNIYSIGVVDTDSSPEGLDLLLPANDDYSKSIKFILKHLINSILKGKKQRQIKNNEYKNQKDIKVKENN